MSGSPKRITGNLVYDVSVDQLDLESDVADDVDEKPPLATEPEVEAASSITTRTYRKSMYWYMFNEMIETVLNHEAHLFDETELNCLRCFLELSYDCQFLLVRLCLRKHSWQRLSKLDFYSELGTEQQILEHVAMLCKPIKELVQMKDDVKTEDGDVKMEDGGAEDGFVKVESCPNVEGQSPPDAATAASSSAMISAGHSAKMEDVAASSNIAVKQESEIIDLTLDEGPSQTRSTPRGPTTHNHDAGPSALPNFTWDVLCYDDTILPLRDLIGTLQRPELQELCKKLKIDYFKKSHAEMVAALLKYSEAQTVLPFASTSKGKGKAKARDAGKPKVQTTLSFARGAVAKSQLQRLRELTMQRVEKSIYVNPLVYSLFQRINLIYFRSTQASRSMLLPCILERADRRIYVKYEVQRTRDVWSSREALLEYEDALAIQAEVDEVLNKPELVPATERVSATPAPVPGTPMATPTEAEDHIPTLKQVMSTAAEESPSVRAARAVKIVLEQVFPRWQGIVQSKAEVERSSGLERFEAGHVLTRVVSKGAQALGTLKEYEREAEVLTALLGQYRYRRARRGKWHERRALLYMTHLKKMNKFKDTAFRDVHRYIEEALEDEYTHLIYRPKLEKRLTTVEKRLRIPADQCHVCEGELRKSEDVFIEGKRVWLDEASIVPITRPNPLVLDNSKRAVNSASPVKRTESTLDAVFKTPGALSTSAKLEASDIDVPKRPEWTGKSIWKGRDGEVSVEQYTLEHFEKLGYKGFHAEGRIITTIFGLLFWDILFAPIAGAFETRYQGAPLDLVEETFYHARKDAIESRLTEVKEGKAKEIVSASDDKYRSKTSKAKGQWCVGVRWDMFEREDLIDFVDCLGGEPLEHVCRLLCEDYESRTSGLPDLCIWNKATRKCSFVEVKGPGDHLMENQKLWIDQLLQAGADVKVCHVAEFGKTMRPKERKNQRKKTPAKARGKKKAKEPVESDSEPEPTYIESEDDESDVPLAAKIPPLRPPSARGKKRATPDEDDTLPDFSGTAPREASLQPPPSSQIRSLAPLNSVGSPNTPSKRPRMTVEVVITSPSKSWTVAT